MLADDSALATLSSSTSLEPLRDLLPSAPPRREVAKLLAAMRAFQPADGSAPRCLMYLKVHSYSQRQDHAPQLFARLGIDDM